MYINTFHKCPPNHSINQTQSVMEMKKASSFISFFFILFSTSFVSPQSDSCSSQLSVSNLIPFNTSSLACISAWSSEDFILRYAKAGPSLWSFVLSAPDGGAYVAIGFSSNGRMVGSSTVAAWKPGGGTGIVKQYYLGGYSSSQCPPDQGNLPLVQGSSLIVSQSSRLYLAFQLDIAQPQTKLVYAVGPSNTFPSSGGYLAQHKSMASGSLTSPATGGGGDGDGDRDEDEGGERDRPSGRKHGDDESSGGDATTTAAAASGGGLSLAKSHALLTIIGWGILLPAGIAMARFMKHYDPSWFYLHTSTQGIGFVAGIVGVIAGFKLERDLGEYGAHKALGVVVLALGCVQVTAILARPKEKSKARKYWNWYHHCVGRAAVVGATANVFYGLWLAKEARDWSYAYGVFVGVWVTACFVLEEWRKKHVVECALCC